MLLSVISADQLGDKAEKDHIISEFTTLLLFYSFQYEK